MPWQYKIIGRDPTGFPVGNWKYFKDIHDNFTMGWTEFWQKYNELFNSQQFIKLLDHVAMNYNPLWNEGKAMDRTEAKRFLKIYNDNKLKEHLDHLALST